MFQSLLKEKQLPKQITERLSDSLSVEVIITEWSRLCSRKDAGWFSFEEKLRMFFLWL